jgi:hypothetical protein
MEQVSPYLSNPKADFTPNYESVAVKRSLDRSIEQDPTIQKAVADQSGR